MLAVPATAAGIPARACRHHKTAARRVESVAGDDPEQRRPAAPHELHDERPVKQPQPLEPRAGSSTLALAESLPMIARLLGNSQIQTTDRYAHLPRHSVETTADSVPDSLAADIETPQSAFPAAWSPPAVLSTGSRTLPDEPKLCSNHAKHRFALLKHACTRHA